MKKRIRVIAALVFLCVLAVGAFAAYRHLHIFYSPRKLEALLEECYGVSFTVGELLPGDSIHAPQQHDELPSRIWLVTADDYPELTFQVKDGWTYSYKVRGFFGGLDDYTVPEKHTVWDDCKAVSWNTYVAPMLAEEYGVENAVIPDKERYSDNLTYSDYPLRLAYEGDRTATADFIFELSEKINSAPIFRDLSPDKEHYDSSFRQYCFRIELYMITPDGEEERSTWLHIYPGYHYTREEIGLKVRESVEKLQEGNCAIEHLPKSGDGV